MEKKFLSTHYVLLKKLGEGGMGEVYLAEDTKLGRHVALKVLSAEFTKDSDRIRRFKQEARAASALNHPSILTIFEIGEQDGTHFIITEFIEGQTLRDYIAHSQRSLRGTLDLIIQVASALTAAHAAGIVHRDIKPENIMIRSDGYVKVLDFGLAKFSEQTPHSSNKAAELTRFETDAGIVMGTTHYMSPEQARGLKVDSRTDIFSLGVVLYEMLAGNVPFDGPTPSDVMVAILDREPPALTSILDVPPELERILGKMLRKDTAERYQTIQDVMTDLKSLKQRLEFEVELERSTSDEQARLKFSGAAAAATSQPLSEASPARPLLNRIRRVTWLWKALAAIVVLSLVGTLSFMVFRKTTSTSNVSSGRSLAILPFHNLKPEPETNFLGFSLADAITTKLSYVRNLTVRPSSAVDKYRTQVIDPQTVGTELKVNTLLTGNYLKDGNDLRITAQLIDVESNAILWRDTLDLKYEKLLTVQDRVADEIVKGLHLNLSKTESEGLKRDIPQNPLAYEYYLRGRDLMMENNFTLAIEMLEKSVALDPQYALSWAYLARSYNANATRQFGGWEYYKRAQEAIDKALVLNPEHPEVQVYAAPLLTETNRAEEAVSLLRHVLKTNPNHARAHWELSYSYRYAGILKESIQEAEQAVKLDPKLRNPIFNCYLYDGQYQVFLKSLNDRHDAPIFIFYRGLAYLYLKERSKASIAFDQAYESDRTTLFSQIGKALSLAIAGKNQEGITLLTATEKQIEDRGVSDGETLYKVAQAYAVLGNKPAALRMFQQSIEHGFFCYPYFIRDELLENIRHESEFKNWMDLAQKRHQDFQKSFF